MCIVFHFRKEHLLIVLCFFVRIIQEIYTENVKEINNLKLLFNNLSKFCLIICYFIEKRISKSNVQIKFDSITFKIELRVKKYDIDELNLLFQIIFFCILKE